MNAKKCKQLRRKALAAHKLSTVDGASNGQTLAATTRYKKNANGRGLVALAVCPRDTYQMLKAAAR